MPEAVLRGRRILVAEDEYLLASALAQRLAEAGAEVVGPVATLRRTMAAIDARPEIELAVLDVNLGGEMVYPAADLLAGRGVPFLFSTGYDADALPPRFLGALRLEKPVEAAAVAEAVVRLLRPAA